MVKYNKNSLMHLLKKHYKNRVFLVSTLIFLLLIGGVCMATIIPSDVKDVVNFIFIINDEGNKVPNGTGFFVGVKSKTDVGSAYIYLVTAKHVLQDKDNKFYSSVYVRLNMKDGGSEFIEIPLQSISQNGIFTHQESTVDIAVIPFAPNQDKYDFKYLPENFLTTKELFESNEIKVGDDIFFTGLFTAHFGKNRNHPIVRFGKVALITDEKVEWEGELMDLYLVELQSFGGNSGSPVFFYLNPTRKAGTIVLGPSKILLAGIMKGSFLSGSKVRTILTDNVPVSFDNIGIAAVIPAYKLYDILFSDKLESLRK